MGSRILVQEGLEVKIPHIVTLVVVAVIIYVVWKRMQAGKGVTAGASGG